jgi:hypothetical protein
MRYRSEEPENGEEEGLVEVQMEQLDGHLVRLQILQDALIVHVHVVPC